MAKNTQQPELSMVDQVRIRREKLAQLQQEGQNPFAQTKFEFTSNSAEIKKNFEQMEEKEVSVSGRLMTKRGMGKVMFCDLQDAAGRIQIYLKIDEMDEAMFGGHALFTISDKTFDRMVAANNGRTGYHIHVSEGMNDVYDSQQNYGRRPVQRLQDHGILGPKTILGHCIHVNTAEIELIKNTDTMVVNNPESNMGNAVGICPVLPLSKAGILLGMGTDAYTNDMLESLKVALCSQRSNACAPNVAWCEVTDMLFKNNAKIGARYFDAPLGVLEPGAAADVIVMDYKPFTPFSDANIDGHMIFGMTGRQCQTTIANGKLLMKDRELIGIDEEAINAHILEESKKLWGALNDCTY